MSIRTDAQGTPLTRRHLVEIAPPWTWAVALTSAGLVDALFVLSVAGRIDIVVRGNGVIQPAEGERSIVADREGTIEYPSAGGHSGDEGSGVGTPAVVVGGNGTERELREDR